MSEVLLICKACCAWVMIEKDDCHPDGVAYEVQYCPECWDLGLDEPVYYDENWEEIHGVGRD